MYIYIYIYIYMYIYMYICIYTYIRIWYMFTKTISPFYPNPASPPTFLHLFPNSHYMITPEIRRELFALQAGGAGENSQKLALQLIYMVHFVAS